MPVRSTVDPARRRIVATVAGEFEIDDILHAIDKAIRHPEFDRGFDIYSDHTLITRPIEPEQLRRMVEHLESLAPQLAGGRWAIVTRKTASARMMRALAIQAVSVPLRVRVFSDASRAERWLQREGTPSELQAD